MTELNNEAITNSVDTGKSSSSGTRITFQEPIIPKQSNWRCYMYGSKPNDSYKTIYIPYEGSVPNRFIRYMMKICLGCTWVKGE